MKMLRVHGLIAAGLVVSMAGAGDALAGGDPAAGEQKAAVCAGCHGIDGNSLVGANPRLAGQYETYLYHALKEYKAGRRNSILMQGMVENLSDRDMRDLAAWYASQGGDTLRVLPVD
jgi:cytochrome c553